jgi:selenocysteine lyase/cysteine desulfurase
VSEVSRRGVEAIGRHARQLMRSLLAGLTENPHITLHGPRTADRRVGVVSLNIAGYDPQELASLLDSQWQIQMRAGLHCAPKMHAALGTAPSGTLRLSVGPFNTEQEIDRVIAVLGEITAA